MPSVLEMQLSPQVNTGPAPVAKAEDQVSHAAAPAAAQANTTSNAKTIVLALAGFMIVIYLLHVAGRAVA